MIEKYNFYVRKRDCYSDKIQANSALKQAVMTGLTNCNDSMNSLKLYCDDAVIFGELYLDNYDKFNAFEVERIIGIFDEIETHLSGVKQSAQDSINYWDYQIKNYEEDEEE